MCSSETTAVVARGGVAGGFLGAVSAGSEYGSSLHYGFDVYQGSYGILSIDGGPTSCSVVMTGCVLGIKQEFGRTLSTVHDVWLTPPSGMSISDLGNAVTRTMMRLANTVPYSYPNNPFNGSFGAGFNSNSIFTSTMYSIYGSTGVYSIFNSMPRGFQAPGILRKLPGT